MLKMALDLSMEFEDGQYYTPKKKSIKSHNSWTKDIEHMLMCIPESYI